MQPSFIGGEFAPTLNSRVDLEKYAIGVKTMKNFFPHVHGGASNRAGLKFISSMVADETVLRLFKFQFSVTQSYCLIFVDELIHIIYDGEILLSGQTAVQIITTYPSAALSGLKFAQSGDILYITHPDYNPKILSRVSHTSWTFGSLALVDGPYLSRSPINLTTKMILPYTSYYRDAHNMGVQASVAAFGSAIVGQMMRFAFNNPLDVTDVQWAWGKILTVTSSTVIVVDFETVPGYEYLINPDFTDEFLAWTEFNATYVFATNRIDLSVNISLAYVIQRVEVPANKTMVVQADFVTVSDGNSVRLRVGTGSNPTDASSYNVVDLLVTSSGFKRVAFSTGTNTVLYVHVARNGGTGSSTVLNSIRLTHGKDLMASEWRMGAFGVTDGSSSGNGFPSSVTFFEQRLCFAGLRAYPTTVFASKTGGFTDFGFNTPSRDDDAVTFSLASGEINPIRWMVPLSALILGSLSSEWRVSGGGNSSAMTPSAIDAKPQSYEGCADIRPLMVGTEVVFLQHGASNIASLVYSLEADGYTTKNLNIISNHLFQGHSIVDWAYSRKPDPIIWAIRNDGILLGLTYFKEQEVLGWHWHETDGLFESVCVLPSATGGDDDIYFVVKRTIGAATKRYIEKLQPRITDEDSYDYFFVDCGFTHDGVATNSIGGLTPLNGKTVVALADGAVVSGLTVTNGAITLPFQASLVHVGLPYTSDLETLRIDKTDGKGSSYGKTKTIPSVKLQLYKTRGLYAGPDENYLEELKLRDVSIGDDPIELFTGDTEIILDSGYDEDGHILIRQTDPIPITVLAIIPEIEVSER